MVRVIYEDEEILAVEKPAGLESQASRDFEPDMVSEIKNYLIRRARREAGSGEKGLSPKLSTPLSTAAGEPYVGVIHRLDKPVSGVMVYAKTRSAAAFLSREVQEHRVTKIYHAVVCGKPVDNVGNFVDNLYMDREKNYSFIVDKSEKDGKRAELSYRVVGGPKERALPDGGSVWLTLLEIELKTGRHHQIRVQLAGHGLPLWGDSRYNPMFGGSIPISGKTEGAGTEEPADRKEGKGQAGAKGTAGTSRAPREPLALAAVRLGFTHPTAKKRMEFSMEPRTGAFRQFAERKNSPALQK